MLISVRELHHYWNVTPIGVVHVGAHEAEELLEYRNNRFGQVIWVEAQPNLAEKLRVSTFGSGDSVIEAAVWHEKDIPMKLKISSNSQSTSLLEFGSHEVTYPDIAFIETIEVLTQTLDDVIDPIKEFNFLNLDIQGAELHALKGFEKQISKLNWIYTEVNHEEVYLGCTLVDDLDAFLATHGFSRKATRWCLGKGWGDALYIRNGYHKRYKRPFGRFASSVRWYLPELARYLRIKFSRYREA